MSRHISKIHVQHWHIFSLCNDIFHAALLPNVSVMCCPGISDAFPYELRCCWHGQYITVSPFHALITSVLSWQRIIHYHDVIMGAMASQITSPTIVYSSVYSGTDQRKHQSSASLAVTGDRWILALPCKPLGVLCEGFGENDRVMTASLCMCDCKPTALMGPPRFCRAKDPCSDWCDPNTRQSLRGVTDIPS